MLACPVTPPDRATARLRAIGLPEEAVLHSSVEAGLTAFMNCPRLAPITGPGQLMHVETVGALREHLEMLGWNAECQHNQEPTISPDGRVRLIVMSGDEATGLEAETPLSRHPRGRLSASNVMRNQLVLDLYPGAVSPGTVPDEQLTWALLHYVDLVAREVRIEVSAPRDLSEDRRVGGWIERIIIDPLPFDGGSDPVRRPVDPAPAHPVDVPIHRLPA